jgi:hypothetical protein
MTGVRLVINALFRENASGNWIGDIRAEASHSARMHQNSVGK